MVYGTLMDPDPVSICSDVPTVPAANVIVHTAILHPTDKLVKLFPVHALLDDFTPHVTSGKLPAQLQGVWAGAGLGLALGEVLEAERARGEITEAGIAHAEAFVYRRILSAITLEIVL